MAGAREILEAFYAVNLTSQDTIVFIDSSVVDMEEVGRWLAGAKAPFGVKNVLFVAVEVKPGKSLKDAIAVYTAEELKEWVKDLENSRNRSKQ